MAFTVDFGDNNDEDKKKKLALRDSIGRFAPKIKNKLNKDNTNCSKEVILDEENNIAHKKDDADAQSDTGTYTIEDIEESGGQQKSSNEK